MDTYRQKVILSYLCIRTSQEDLMDRIINVGMSGEYQDIGKTFSPEDSYEFDIVQFRDTGDITLNTLIRLFDEMEDAKELIKNIHVITDEEIGQVLPEWLALIGFDQYEDDDFDENSNVEDSENLEDWEDWDDLN